jgi:hypothetical protein
MGQAPGLRTLVFRVPSFIVRVHRHASSQARNLLFLSRWPMLHSSSFPLVYGCSKNAPGVPVRATELNRFAVGKNELPLGC